MQPGCQTRQGAAAVNVAFTPLPSVIVCPDMHASAILSLTMVNDTPSAATAQIRTTNPMDGFKSSEDEERGGRYN